MRGERDVKFRRFWKSACKCMTSWLTQGNVAMRASAVVFRCEFTLLADAEVSVQPPTTKSKSLRNANTRVRIMNWAWNEREVSRTQLTSKLRQYVRNYNSASAPMLLLVIRIILGLSGNFCTLRPHGYVRALWLRKFERGEVASEKTLLLSVGSWAMLISRAAWQVHKELPARNRVLPFRPSRVRRTFI